MKLTNQIEGFEGYMWKREINVRDFIQHNYTPYTGDESFLAGPTAKTLTLWNELSEMFKVEREKACMMLSRSCHSRLRHTERATLTRSTNSS